MFSHEIQNSLVLKWSLGSLVFSYFIVFTGWHSSAATATIALSNLDYVCPRYFQSCEFFYFLQSLPYGYSQSIFYMGLFLIMAWSIYLMSQRAWAAAQQALIPLWVWHFGNVIFFTEIRSGNYEYYLIVFGFILLFLPHKEFFLKLSLVWFYTLSTLAKLHPSWIIGSYFSTLKTGLPLFPDWSIPLFTNTVILAEMIGSWFLLSSKPRLQKAAFYFFVFFHLYSGILVGYRYPATVLPFLLILCGPWYRYTPVPLTLKSLFGWGLILILLFLQISPKLIPGDEKLTLEGNKYGLYMFEANHQCFSHITINYRSAQNPDTIVQTSPNARHRCDPYETWFKLQNICKRNPSVQSIAWELNHSINGGPFYKIVNTKNACELPYHPFRHNDWIQTSETASIIGYPVKNFYR